MVYRSLLPKYQGLFYFTVWIPCLLECFSKQAKMPLHFHSFFGLPLPAQLLHSHWLFYWEINMMALSAFLRSSMISFLQFSSVQSLSHVRLSATTWIAACQASLSITNSQSSLRLTVHRVSDAIQPSHPLSSPSPPALSLSQHQGLFQWISSSHQVAKVLELSASAPVLPMNFKDWIFIFIICPSLSFSNCQLAAIPFFFSQYFKIEI